MGTAPINNPNNAPALTPTRRNTDTLPPANDGAPAPAAAPTPTTPRDSAKTGPLDPTAVPPEVNLDSVKVPDPPKKEDHGFFGNLWDGAKNLAHKAENAVETVAHDVEKVAQVGADVVASGVHGVEEGYKHGDGILGSLGDGLHAAGQTAFTEAANPVLDKAIGKADKADDKAAGALGPLLTDRLAVGDSVDIKIEAGATLPTELVGAPNIKLDGGGTLKIKRVAAQDANGQPIIGADGKPETRLEVELKAEGRAGAAYSAKVGFQETVSAMGHDAGIKAQAKAEAEAGLTGSLDLKLRFNPDNAQDMGDLLAMTKATAATGAAAAVPGLGTLVAAMDVKDYKRSMDTLGSHLEEFGGEGGLYAQANASAKLNLGIFKSAPQTDPAAAAADTGVKDKPNLVQNLANQQLDNAHGKILDKLNLNIAGIGAGLGAQGQVGAKHNFRTGETTYTVDVQGSANASASVLGAGEKLGATGNRKINLVFGPDGKLKNVTVQQNMTRDEFKGVMTTVADVYGRPLNPGVIAGLQQSDTVQVNYQLKPELLAQVSQAKDPAAIFAAAKAVTSAAITKDRFKLDQGDIITTHRDQVNFNFDVGAALGAEIDVRGGVTLGHSEERVVS